MKDSELDSAQKADNFIEQQARTALGYVRERRSYFQKAGAILSKHARNMSRCSAIATVLVIVLGAFVGTKAVMDNLLGATNMVDALIYAPAGLLIAVLSGLESTFKWSSQAAELRQIAAKCRRSEHAIDIGLRTIHTNDLEAAMTLLKQANAILDEIESEAFKIGCDLQMPADAGRYSTEQRLAVQSPGERSSALLGNMEDTAHTVDRA